MPLTGVVWVSQAWVGQPLPPVFCFVQIFGVEDMGTLDGWKTDGHDLCLTMVAEELDTPSFTFLGDIFSPKIDGEF